MEFLYDDSGSPYSFVYDGVQYYYVKNLQGDVIQIRSVYGTLLVEYAYDAWGNVIDISGSYASTLGADNPIRYRSYYYDTETGFYYLQSRYYDPAIRRFINADGYVNSNGDFIGFNMYAYCSNNPVTGYDPTGTFDWNALKEFGVGCLKATILVTGVTSAFLSVGAAVAGTAFSGGAGAVAIPVAVSVAAKAIAVSVSVSATIGATAVATATVGENISNSTSNSKRKTNVLKYESEIFNSFEKIKGKSYRTSGKGRDKRYYDWDYTHNDIEVYDRNGNHLGSMDPTTGEMYKSAVKGRKLLW